MLYGRTMTLALWQVLLTAEPALVLLALTPKNPKMTWHRWQVLLTGEPALVSLALTPETLRNPGTIRQVLLTGEPALVSLAAALLEEVLAPNADALGGLAQTGAFFFALAYCGSNLTEVARLLQVRAQARAPCSRCSEPGLC